MLEADSFEFHSDAEALVRDIERYNRFVIEGWTVLRFGWRHVMEQPEYVLTCLRAVLCASPAPLRVHVSGQQQPPGPSTGPSNDQFKVPTGQRTPVLGAHSGELIV